MGMEWNGEDFQPESQTTETAAVATDASLDGTISNTEIESESEEQEASAITNQEQQGDGGEEQVATPPTTDPSQDNAPPQEHWSSKFYQSEEDLVKEREELTTLREKVTKLSPLEKVESDAFLKGYVQHLENGDDPKAYLQTQMQLQALDLNTMDKEEMVKQAHVLQNIAKGLTNEEALEEWEEYKDEKFFDEATKERKLKIAAIDAKAFLESHKQKMSEPIQPQFQQPQATPEQLEAAKKANEAFIAKWNKEYDIEHKFKVGEKEISIKEKGNLFTPVENVFTKSDPFADFLIKQKNEKGEMVDVVDEEKYSKAMYLVKNQKAIFAKIYKQAQTDFEADKLREARNPTPQNAAVSTGSDPLRDKNLQTMEDYFGK